MRNASGRGGKKQAEQAEAVALLSPVAAGDRAVHLAGMLAGREAASPLDARLRPPDRPYAHELDGVQVEAADRRLERIVAAEQLISWARSQQWADLAAMALSAELAGGLGGPRAVGDRSSVPLSVLDKAEFEVQVALTLSRRQAALRLDDAASMRRLPRVMALVRSGLIDQGRAEAISRSMNEYLTPTGDAGDDAIRWDRVEEKVTARAHSRTAAILRHDVAKAALAVDPQAAERKRVKAREDREVRMWRRPDGMAGIEALLDAESAAIVDNTLTLLADAQRDAAARAGTPDERTHAQRRADALTGVFRAIADGRPLRMHPLVPAATAGCGPAPSADQGAAAGTAAADTGFSEDGRFIPACFMRPDQDGARADGAEGAEGASGPHGAGPADDQAATTPPAAVPAWWEPPHLPRQQRRRPHLVLTISARTLAGWDDLPGELAGYGAITAEAARDLARRCGSADLVILDPPPGSTPDCTPACRPARAGRDPDSNGPPGGGSGARPPVPGPRSPGPSASGSPAPAYKPRDQVIRDVLARNRTCRAPGCTRPAQQCDLDHVIPFGTEKRSCACNLVPLCRRHHRLKTFGGWSITLDPPEPGEAAGAVEWVSPTGRRYLVPPPDQPGSAHW